LKAVKLLNSFVNFIENVNLIVGHGISFFTAGMIFPIIIEVVSRYVFSKPTIWGLELSMMFFGPFWILGAGYTLLQGGHVNMDVLYNRFSPRGRAILDVITSICFFIFFIIMLREGIEFAMKSWAIREHSESLWAPIIYPIKTILPIGVLLLLLQGLAKFIRNLSFAITGREIISPSKVLNE